VHAQCFDGKTGEQAGNFGFQVGVLVAKTIDLALGGTQSDAQLVGFERQGSRSHTS
jgi:hypothetical protein